MNQPDRTNITIRFDTVNICFGTQITAEPSPSGKTTQEQRIKALFSPGVPQPDKTLPVRPSTSSALGTICASVTYPLGSSPDEVRAFVYPAEYFPSPPPGDTPPTQAMPGTSSTTGTTVCWTWNSGNPVPGANYSMGGNANQLAIWKKTAGTWHFDGTVPFTGVTGTTGPCGSGSGSGSGSKQSVSPPGKTFPAIWCAVIRGFSGTPLPSLNANWALRQVAKASVPTWDNGGGDGGTVKVTLTLDKQRGWDLTLAVQQIRITYTLPFRDHAFGPLHFPARQENVAPVGMVSLPAIDVFAM